MFAPNVTIIRMRARARLDFLLNAEGRYEIASDVLPVDSLKFKDSKKYPERIKEAMELTGETDALVVMGGAMHPSGGGSCFEFDFMGGSMGSVVGERFAQGVQNPLSDAAPFSALPLQGVLVCKEFFP